MANIKGWEFKGQANNTETYASENEAVMVFDDDVIAKVRTIDSDILIATKSCFIRIDLEKKTFTFAKR